VTVRLRFDGRPQTKQRAKGGLGRHFTPAETRAAQTAIALQASIARGRFSAGDLEVRIDFYVRRRKGQQVGDIDNLAKLVLDGLQMGGVMGNDRQVKRLELEIHMTDDREETVVEIRHRQTVARTTS
jgi:Holliday junction resolvase RusA-like endonuclease